MPNLDGFYVSGTLPRDNFARKFASANLATKVMYTAKAAHYNFHISI